MRLWPVAALFLLSACATHQPPRQPVVREVQIDSAYADFLAEYRELLPTERVLCLYGVVRNDTAWLAYIRPAKMRQRTENGASYDSCPAAPPYMLTLRYLGTWHHHKLTNVDWDDLCRFSQVDDNSFNHDKNGILELLSCRGKLMARSKYK